MKKNTIRYYASNRVVWLSTITLALFLTIFGNDREFNLIIFFVIFCLYCLAGAYITDNPNASERLMFRKYINYLKSDRGE